MVTGLLRAGHRVHAAGLDAVAAFDAASVAVVQGSRTTRRWLEQNTQLSPGQAGAMVSTARALRDHLPATRVALAAGEISAAHAQAVTSVVRLVGVEHAVAAEPILLPPAKRAEPSVVRRATAQLHAYLDPDAAERALERDYERRQVLLAVVGNRGYLQGVLDIESVETLQAALIPLMSLTGPADPRGAGQRRADALIDLARRALDAGEVPVLGAERPHLSVVVDADSLADGRGTVTLPWTGGSLPARSLRRWACDGRLSAVLARTLPSCSKPLSGRAAAGGAGVAGGAVAVDDAVAMVRLAPGWLPLAVGRTARTATPAIVRALKVRDGGCVHPGCARTAAFCDAHHVHHWIDGGATELSNMVLLCRHHHRTLHAHHWRIDPDPGTPGRFWITQRDGQQQPAQIAADRSPPLVPA